MRTLRDPATTHDLRSALDRILPSIERFREFEGPGPSRHRTSWMAALDRPLPRHGLGGRPPSTNWQGS